MTLIHQTDEDRAPADLADPQSQSSPPVPPSHLAALVEPDVLRGLGRRELDGLASDIRDYLVEILSWTGGHLGPNLGVVELTLALHRVFSSPRDAILWDTGHQAYVHKLVTGRADRFPTLRQAGGLSGYPNRAESPHDHIENSHASTALSYAFGMAHGPGGRRVVAVVGDGALTGGLAYEALATIGAAGLDVVVVLNDNGRSYAPTVSRLTTAPDARPDAVGEAWAAGPGGPAGPGRPGEAALASAAPSAPARFFDSLGFAYLGPVDGHDVTATEAALRDAAAFRRPVVVHVHTRKGEGHLPCRADEEKRLHDVPPARRTAVPPADGTRCTVPAGAPASFTASFAAAIVREADRRPELVAVTAAMAGPTGLRELATRHPDRVVDVGIAEQHAVAAAAGMAMAGRRPVVAVYSTFLNRAWDQVVHDVALHRLPVVFCLDRAGVTGDDGPSHHGVLDLVLLTKVPGMTVLAPSCAEEVGPMLSFALDRVDGPVAIRWPKTPSPPPVAGPCPTGLGARARRVRVGRDVCLLGVGPLVHACDRAADLLAADGCTATVWDVRCAGPLDAAMLEDAAGHAVVVTAEDGFVDGGVGTAVRAGLRSMGAGTPVDTCGIPTRFLAHGRADRILADLGLDAPGIAATARRALVAGPA